MQNIDCELFMQNAKKLAEKEDAENAARYEKERNDKEVAALEKFKLIFPQLKFVKKAPDYGNVYDICGHYFTIESYFVVRLVPYKPDWVKYSSDWRGYCSGFFPVYVDSIKSFGDYLIWAEKRAAHLKQQYEAEKQQQEQIEKRSFWDNLFS
jgi:hypothetical protein